MTVSLVQWPAAIGIFNCRSLEMHKNFICNKFKVLVTILECLFLCHHYLESFFFCLLFCICMFLLLRSHGDIDLNPGPCESNDNNLSVCHWNLISKSAHNFSKLIQLNPHKKINRCLTDISQF